MDYSEELFANYYESHSKYDGIDIDKADKYFQKYYNLYWKKYFSQYKKDSKILEIGCNAGYMLRVLHNEGFTNLTGIDLSVGDLNIAKEKCSSDIKLLNADAFDFLKNHVNEYELIFSRAVFEHIKKDNVLPLIKLCNNSIKNTGGALLLDVPNMDWIYASHERYMDFTHEVGYTIESLGQLLRDVFPNVDLCYAMNSQKLEGFSIRTFFARPILAWLLHWSEPCLSKEKLFNKCLIGFAKK